MNQYNARDLLNMPLESLWGLPNERHEILFEDGKKIQSHTRETILSVYHWFPLLKYEQAPILPAYHIAGRQFTSKLQIQLINAAIWGIHAHYNEEPDTGDLALLAFETIGRYYNDFTTKLSEYVMTLSMFDVLEVMDHPDVVKANREVKPTTLSIAEECYPAIENAIMTSPQLKGNPIAEAAKAKTLKMGQLLQCVGPRGFITDIDSTIFPHPIMTGYIEGMTSLHDVMIESRSGSKSLIYNKDLLRGTEYFNRKTQLVAQYVQRLQPGDCGTPHLIDMPILTDTLKNFRGKYYVNEAGVLDWIRGDETHLEGTTLKMRSVLGCIHPDPQGVCATCYGRLSFSVPKGTNIGHISAVSMGDKITSSVLATKHLDSTSRVEPLELQGNQLKYLRHDPENETFYLARRVRNVPIKITVSKEEVKSLADVLMDVEMETYPTHHASQLTQMKVTADTGKEGVDNDVIDVSQYNRKASFSREMLYHIRKTRWEHDARGNVIIDLDGFDRSKPFLTLPYKHISMYDVMARVQSFLHSGSDSDNLKLVNPKERANRQKKDYLKGYRDPALALQRFFKMLTDKLDINITHCEVLVYAMMVRSTIQRDYRLPVPGVSGVFEKYTTIMQNRSLAAAMAFEDQERPLSKPGSFVRTNRNDHPYDFLQMGGDMSR